MIICGDALTELRKMPEASINCCVTSPPYWGLRDYGVAGQLGLERTPEEYVAKLVAVFREVRRVLRDDGALWLNLGDCYNSNPASTGVSFRRDRASVVPCHRPKPLGLKPKDLVGIPWRVAFALQADGWYLRSDIIWAKPNPMPESVKDRPTRSHEYIFLLTKSERYYYDYEAIREPGTLSSIERLSQDVEHQTGSLRVPGKTNGPMKAAGKLSPSRIAHDMSCPGHRAPGQTAQKGNRDKQRGHSRRHAGFNERWDSMTREEQCSVMRNRRDVWHVATQPFPEAHFATFPPGLIEPCILAGCPNGGIVLDPFFGAGTTGLVAKRLGREFVGIELNPAYCEMARRRIYGPLMMTAEAPLPLSPR